MSNDKSYDVLIVGGSYAGLSAAMALGRSVRTVLVIDDGKPCNRQTPHSHNFLTQDGKTPLEISTLARQQVERYDTVEFFEGRATSGKKTEVGFEIETNEGNIFLGRKLVFASGIKDLIPDVQGLSDCWGISVIHCPYCHGYEYREKRTGIMADGERAMHLASLVSNLTENLSILTSGQTSLTSEQIEKLEINSIEIIENNVSEIDHENGFIRHVVFDDGTKMGFDALYAAVPFVQSSDIPSSMGCNITEEGYIEIDPFYETTVKGVYACGDNASFKRSVANAVAAGNMTGAVINRSLVESEF